MRRRRGDTDEHEGDQDENIREKEKSNEINRCGVYKIGEPGRKLRVIGYPCVVWLCIGLAIGSICGGPWCADLVDFVRGYRWNYLDRCILETPDTHGFGVDFCRIPVDCSECSDVRKIDEIHVDDLSQELFEERYAYSNRPLVVRNVSLHWEIMEVLDYHWLKKMYSRDPGVMDKTGDECWFNKYKTQDFRNLRTVFKMPESRVQMKTGGPWYVGWAVCHEEIAEELFKLFERPHFIHPDSTPPKKPWIFIGTPGPGAHLHVDNVDLASWQVQLRGAKTWYLKSAPECWWSCHGFMQTTLYPGDVIIVNTNVWFHGTKVLGPDLSISMVNEFD